MHHDNPLYAFISCVNLGPDRKHLVIAPILRKSRGRGPILKTDGDSDGIIKDYIFADCFL